MPCLLQKEAHMALKPFQSIPFLALKGFVSSRTVKMTASAIAGAVWGADAAQKLGAPAWQGAVIGAPLGVYASWMGGETGSWAPVFVSALLPFAGQYVADHIGLPPELTNNAAKAIGGSYANFGLSIGIAGVFRCCPNTEHTIVDPLPKLKGARKRGQKAGLTLT